MSNYKEINISTNSINSGNDKRRSQIYRGISTVNPNTTNFNLYDADLIKQDLLNHFNIRKGEKIYNANFGTIIWDTLFEPLTEQARDIILEDVLNIFDAEPRINAKNVSIIQKAYGLQVYAELEFIKHQVVEQILFDFDRNNGLSLA